MFWTFLLLVLMVAMGGFVSYYGDLQGRRWGRKRVSWFGLRPKHTAILITIITGSTISLLSIAILFAISAPVREVILHGEQAIVENRLLVHQQSKITTQLKLTESQVEQAKRDLTGTQQELHAQHHALDSANRQLTSTRLLLASAQLLLLRRQARVTELKAQMQQQTKAINQLKAEAGIYRAGNLRLSQDSSRYAQRVHLQQLSLHEAELKLTEARNQVAAYNAFVTGASRLTRVYLAVRQGRICVRAHSELARCRILKHDKVGSIVQQLLALLDTAGHEAQRYGASPGTNGRAVRIMPKTVQTSTGAQSTTEMDSINALADNLAGSDQDVLVTVTAFSNAVANEQVLVDLHAHIIRPAFIPGQIIAQKVINTSVPSRELQQAIAEFLQTDVRNAALKAGIVPIVDPVTGVGEIGNFGPFALVQLALQAGNTHGAAIIRAVAITPISSADMLDRSHLRLEIVGVQGGTSAPGK